MCINCTFRDILNCPILGLKFSDVLLWIRKSLKDSGIGIVLFVWREVSKGGWHEVIIISFETLHFGGRSGAE